MAATRERGAMFIMFILVHCKRILITYSGFLLDITACSINSPFEVWIVTWIVKYKGDKQ